MAGVKRTASDDSCDGDSHSEESSPRKQLKPAPEDWCSECGALAKDLCGENGHTVVDIRQAEAEVQAQFAEAHKHVVRMQGRLDALVEARVRHGPVLTAVVEEVDEEGWRVPGGDIRISMATVPSNLTTEEKEAVCEALRAVSIDYKMKGPECTLGFGHVDADALDALKTVLRKLPPCLEGQTVQRGTVLLQGSQLQVVFKKMRLNDRGMATQLFGYLNKSSQDALEGSAYNEDTQVVPVDLYDVKFAK